MNTSLGGFVEAVGKNGNSPINHLGRTPVITIGEIMAEQTGISWTDSTFNPWWGCTKVAPGCDNCYAAALDKRIGGNHWENKPRVMSESNWKKPLSWNRKAAGRHLVFCGSMCDVFDKNAPSGQRERLWELIRQTPNLTWQLLTKRAPNIEKYLPDDWGEGYPNVWLGVTVEDRKYGIPRADILSKIPAKLRFLSCEPLLEQVMLPDSILDSVGWVIVGFESGPGCRFGNGEKHERLIRTQCRRKRVPYFFKQWGGLGKDKGGCLLYGVECKEFPKMC